MGRGVEAASASPEVSSRFHPSCSRAWMVRFSVPIAAPPAGALAADSVLAGGAAAAAAGVAGPGRSPPVTATVVMSGGWSAKAVAWAAELSGVVPGGRLGV